MDEVPAELPRVKAMLDAALAAPGGGAASTASPPSTAAAAAAAAPQHPATTQTALAAAPGPAAAQVPITASAAAADPASGAPIASPAAAAAPGRSDAMDNQPAAAVPPAAVTGESHNEAHALTYSQQWYCSSLIGFATQARIVPAAYRPESRCKNEAGIRVCSRPGLCICCVQAVQQMLRQSARSSCRRCWRRCCALAPVRTAGLALHRRRGVPCTAASPEVAQRPHQVRFQLAVRAPTPSSPQNGAVYRHPRVLL